MTTTPAAPAPAPPAPSFARALVSVGRNDGAHRAALRVGVSVLVPLLAVYLAGHIEWSVYVAFGAFASVYGRNVIGAARLRMQGTAAVVMVASVVLGAIISLAPGSEWMIVAVASVWSVVAALLSQAARFTPPGPLFAVFALCAVASIPASAMGSGTAGTGILVAFGASAASALLALAFGQADRLWAACRARVARGATRATSSASAPTPRRGAANAIGASASGRGAIGGRASGRGAIGGSLAARLRSVLSSRASVLSAVRFGVAVALAGSLSTLLGIGHPYWAMVAAVVPLVAFELAQTVVRGAQRVIGTLVGLVVAWGLLALQPSGVCAIAIVVAMQIAAELVVLRNYALALVFITPLALVMVSMAHPVDPATLVADRGVETLLGTAVAIAVAWAWSAARRTLR